MPEPTTMFSAADVEVACQRLNDNRYGGLDDMHDLDREDITEIVRLVLTATWDRIYDEGRERGLREATEGSDWAALLRFAREYVDAGECSFDHHGGCQAHGWLSPRPGEQCPNAETKALLARLVGPEEPAEEPDPIAPEVYGEFFPERDDAGEPLSAEPARGGTVTAVPDTHPGFAVLDPTAPLDHAVLDRLEVVSHNGVDDREGWSEITMRDRPEDGR